MACGPAQAKGGNPCIYVHTAARQGKIKNGLADSGDMWIATSSPAKAKYGSVESVDVLTRCYQRLLAGGE
jgi:hypothetical protein